MPKDCGWIWHKIWQISGLSLFLSLFVQRPKIQCEMFSVTGQPITFLICFPLKLENSKENINLPTCRSWENWIHSNIYKSRDKIIINYRQYLWSNFLQTRTFPFVLTHEKNIHISSNIQYNLLEHSNVWASPHYLEFLRC